MNIINIGSINWDHVYQVSHFVQPGETLGSNDYQRVLGGKGANQSAALALAGARVTHVGAVQSGDDVVSQLGQLGIDISGIESRDVATGHAIIQVNADAENAIVLFPGANHSLTTAQLQAAFDKAHSDDWVLLQNETNLVSDAVELAKSRGLHVAFNPAPMDLELTKQLLPKVDLLIVNEIEAQQLAGEDDLDKAVQTCLGLNPNLRLLITLGAMGVRCVDSKTSLTSPGFKVQAVDTTAAGDTFIGYFLASISQGLNTADALQRASAAAAICVTRTGAIPAIPSSDDVQQFMGSQK